MNKVEGILVWMMFLLASNTGVLLTMARERIYFRRVRHELAGFLPPGYDSERLQYPYLLDFTTPVAWKAALERHCAAYAAHPARKQWLRFRSLRNGLMIAEAATLAGFVAWMFLG